MQKHKSQFPFDKFISLFPEVELPVTLTEESALVFQQKNEVLPQLAVNQYLEPMHLGRDDDEYAEYMPCFRIPETTDIHAFILACKFDGV